MISRANPRKARTRTLARLLLFASGCATPAGLPSAAPDPASGAAGAATGRAPRVERQDPFAGGGGERPPSLVALEAELRRGMTELAKKADPPPYFMSYELFDRDESIVSASYGALVQSTSRRTRLLDTDVRVGNFQLDSTHPLRADAFDFGGDLDTGHAVALPLAANAPAGVTQAVAWLDTDRTYKSAAEAFVKIRTQRMLKAAEEDDSDDFSHEKPATYVGKHVPLVLSQLEREQWEERLRKLSARFKGHPQIHDSQVTLQVSSVGRGIVNSEGTFVVDGQNYVRVYLQADTRADDGMELDRFEGFDAASFASLAGDAEMVKAADAMIADLEALRKAPLADPFIGPAILEGKAAGVFFHEIFGHRVEGHRQKNEEEGQTFARKVGQPIMPAFISVYDDPTLTRLGGVDLNGFYRFDDEGVPASRAMLVERGILKGFVLSRSPTRGFNHSNGHGRRQEGKPIVSRQGNLVVESATAVSVAELRRLLRAEATRQGKPYGLLFKDISGGFTNTARGGPQAFKVLPILVYRVFADGRPDQLVRGADLVGTPLASLTKILAAADDYQTFNGMCGAESGYVPVSATSPSLLVEQIEVERKDKGNNKPPALPAPSIGRVARGGSR
ncbi:MAG TPA: metallopeptidase TldD-related protein [Polyangia bacterium]|jgi:predicted Zn-dependent protease|nr:metallopeptidase TldD-related protein [Polyangia bacterium]